MEEDKIQRGWITCLVSQVARGVSTGVSRWQVTVARRGPFPVPGAVSAGGTLVACLTIQEPGALTAVL